MKAIIGAALAALLLQGAPAEAGRDLDGIRQRGSLRCGINNAAGFASVDTQGNWTGFNADFCRAIAITIFGDPSKVNFVPITPQTRFPALANGEVDVLVSNATWTLTRDTAVNRLNFPAVIFYDGNAIMVRRSLNITSARQLNGATLCVTPGSTTELNMADFFRQNGGSVRNIGIDQPEELIRAYGSGRCDAFASDFGVLAAARTQLADPQNHVILPERMSKEPLGPAVRQGDEELTNIVAWTVFATVEAEELGVSQANVSEMARSTNPAIRRFLGAEGNLAQSLGASDGDYALRIIRTLGHYGEIFERHLGRATPLALERGQNDLWTRGGLLYAPPAR